MRRILWWLGCLALLAAWCGPLPQMAGSSFSAHMSLHMAIVAIAAPLLSLGIAGSRFDPVGYLPRLFAPVPASVIELIIVWAWHAPVLHHAARHTTVGFMIEQFTFVVAGVWVWLSAFGGCEVGSGQTDTGVLRLRSEKQDDDALVQRRGAGVLGLLLTSMHMTFLGALLALSPRLLFSHPHSHGGLSALADQHLGGAIMLVVGGIAYLLGGLWLTADVIRLKQTLEPTDAL